MPRDRGGAAASRDHPRLPPVLVITSKSPYAVRALAELARRGGTSPVPIGEIARARDIPVQFLEGLFATLRRAGILQSQRGVKGGYTFARPPSEITVLEVVELLEGELGTDAPANGAVWTEAVEAVKSVLSGSTIAEVAGRGARAPGPPMYYIKNPPLLSALPLGLERLGPLGTARNRQ